MSEKKSLRVRVSDFMAQRGIKFYSVPFKWATDSKMILLLGKIGMIRGGLWTPRPDTSISSLIGDVEQIGSFLNQISVQRAMGRTNTYPSMNDTIVCATTGQIIPVPQTDPNIPRMWIAVGTVNYPSTSVRTAFSIPLDPDTQRPFSGPTAHVLGVVVCNGNKQNHVATINSLCTFDTEIQDYLTGWALTLRRSKKPSNLMINQMKKEIARLLVARFISSYDAQRKIRFFSDSVSFPLAFTNFRQQVPSGSIVPKQQMLFFLEAMLREHAQEIVDTIVCSAEVDRPEYMRGGGVRLPESSPVCQLKLNGKFLKSGRLFQSFLQSQLDPKDNENMKPELYDDNDDDSDSNGGRQPQTFDNGPLSSYQVDLESTEYQPRVKVKKEERNDDDDEDDDEDEDDVKEGEEEKRPMKEEKRPMKKEKRQVKKEKRPVKKEPYLVKNEKRQKNSSSRSRRKLSSISPMSLPMNIQYGSPMSVPFFTPVSAPNTISPYQYPTNYSVPFSPTSSLPPYYSGQQVPYNYITPPSTQPVRYLGGGVPYSVRRSRSPPPPSDVSSVQYYELPYSYMNTSTSPVTYNTDLESLLSTGSYSETDDSD